MYENRESFDGQLGILVDYGSTARYSQLASLGTKFEPSKAQALDFKLLHAESLVERLVASDEVDLDECDFDNGE